MTPDLKLATNDEINEINEIEKLRFEQASNGALPANAAIAPTPPRPPTERERKDSAIKFLSQVMNTSLTPEQAALFPELCAAIDSVACHAKGLLKEML